MGYIKSGIVTRIEILKNEEESSCYIENNFNMDLFDNHDNVFLLKQEVLQQNLIEYREEFLLFSEGKCDSLDDCEAYCLEISINKMLESKIYLTEDNKNFYFGNYKNMKFETDICIYDAGNISLKIFFIPIFWDINRVIAEYLNNITTTVNNLTRKAMKNILKDASWFTII